MVHAKSTSAIRITSKFGRQVMADNNLEMTDKKLDQESPQALLLEEAYQLGYHKVRDGCLQEPLVKLNDLLKAERNKAKTEAYLDAGLMPGITPKQQKYLEEAIKKIRSSDE